MVSTGPVLPQVALVLGAVAVGIVPEFSPWELGKTAVIVSSQIYQMSAERTALAPSFRHLCSQASHVPAVRAQAVGH